MSNVYFYKDDFISNSADLFSRLSTELDWEKRVDAPRMEYWTNTYNRSYTYGRGKGIRTYLAKKDHELIIEAREKLKSFTGDILEGCFLNFYETKRDWLGWHSDNDIGINHDKPIAVITVGQGRNIQFRKVIEISSEENKNGVYSDVETIMLKPGSLLLMLPGMQFTHQHRIPKADFEVKPRISLTFRGLVE
jgi:alkylated DNA repair dioxygenase AlkB